MKDALLKKTKYLLSFKVSSEVNEGYRKLLEQVFFSFFESLENIYNNRDEIPKSKYYNMILNKTNMSIKSIIIPSSTFHYHDLGFLELGSSLKKELTIYVQEGIPITQELKSKILKMKCYIYMLQALKNNKDRMGFHDIKQNRFKYLEKYLNEKEALTLAGFDKKYKKEFLVICPDGTKFNYCIYTKCLSVTDILNVNACSIIENLFDCKTLMNSELDSNFEVLDRIDQKYSCLLGETSDYTPIELIDEFLHRIEKEQSLYKKIEYFKKLNLFLLQILDYKITELLNHKEKEKVAESLKVVKKIEEAMLYNMNSNLHNQMPHVEVMITIKRKLNNYLKQNSEKVENKYIIHNLDGTRENTVTSSVEPIFINNQYILVHIISLKEVQNKVLVKADFDIVNFQNLSQKIYTSIYFSLKELKDIYSSKDLGTSSKKNDEIRKLIANRLINPTIMDIIKTERHNFLGEFIYSSEEDRAIIYKNKSIEEILGNVV